MEKFAGLFVSCLNLGRLPAPGAWGSLVGWLLAWFFPGQALGIFLCLTFLGYFFTEPAVKVFKSPDPSPFILDEVCGMMLCVLGLPHHLAIYVAAYILFRILDVAKPGPIGWLEKHFHPFSIMNDDLLAGLFTNLILQAVLALLLRIGI